MAFKLEDNADPLLFAGIALESAQDEVLWADAGGRIVYANRSACIALEYLREELLGMIVSDICPDMPEHLWLEHWRELKSAGRMVLEVRQRSRSGKYRLVEVSFCYVNHEGREYSCALGRDITDRKRVEHDLTEAKQQLETIFDTMQAGIVLVNPQGVITFANQRMAAMLRCTLNDIIGSSYPEHVHPDQRNVGDELMHRLLTGVIDHVHHERHYIRRDGSDFWGHLSGRRHEDGQGNLISLVGVIADISGIRQAMDLLEASEEKFSRAFSHAPVMMTISEIETGRCLEVNDRFCAVSGYIRQDVLGRTSVELGCLSPAERERMLEVFKRDGRISDMEITMSAPDGRQIFCLVSVERITLKSEDRLLSISLDITGRKQDLEALDYANECFTQALNGPQHILYRLNVKKGGYDYLSPIFEKITGYRVADFMNTSLEQLQGYFHPDDRERVFGEIDEALSTRTGSSLNFDLEYRLRKADGSYCWLHDSTTACFSEIGELECFFGSVHDITERKRGEEDRRYLEKQLLHAQKLESLGVLAGGIAHDFNNILMAIIGNTDLALMRIDKGSPVVDNLQCIEQSAARAADLARQMLAYSGKGKFVVDNIDLNSLLEEMLQMLRVSISKKATLQLNLHTHLPLVEADATQIHQIIMNLVINASEALGEKNGVIAIATGFMECDSGYLKDVWLDESLTEGQYVYLEIADTGCGMDSDTLAKIFDPFFTTKFTGRGLGMAAVLGIIRGHKGAIKVNSEAGKGSTFKILFPASGKPAEIFNDESQVDEWCGRGTVLLVDDEESVRCVGFEMLKELGFTAVTAGDGREALKIYTATPNIAFVILDLTMPHMDGEQCFRELRQINPGVKVIMSSGFNEQEVTQKFAGKGLDGFIQKPYRLSTLQEVIRNITG